MADIAINQERFSSADVEVFGYGRVIPGVVKMDWKEKQDVNGVKVVGNRKDVGFTRGNYGVEGTLTLLEEEIAGLEISAGRSILTLRGDFTITKVRDGLVTKETLKNLIIKERGASYEGTSTGALQFDCPFYASDFIPFKG